MHGKTCATTPKNLRLTSNAALGSLVLSSCFALEYFGHIRVVIRVRGMVRVRSVVRVKIKEKNICARNIISPGTGILSRKGYRIINQNIKLHKYVVVVQLKFQCFEKFY